MQTIQFTLPSGTKRAFAAECMRECVSKFNAHVLRNRTEEILLSLMRNRDRLDVDMIEDVAGTLYVRNVYSGLNIAKWLKMDLLAIIDKNDRGVFGPNEIGCFILSDQVQIRIIFNQKANSYVMTKLVKL
jgi:hypothetical protein